MPDLLVSLLLAVVGLLVYVPSLSSDFVTLDDFMYVVDNEAVRSPGWDSVRRFFLEVRKPTTVEGYYQPLTMLSLMFDAWLSGDRLTPFYFHLSNIIWHALNGALLYCLLRMIVADRIAALLAAAVFVCHPVQVESVAWVSQRKSVLAVFFALLSLIAYIDFARRRRWLSFAACLLCSILANLAKPTAMPLPLIFFLFDRWPLRRSFWRALPEKLIFLPIMAAAAWVSWVSQSSTAVLGAPRFDTLDMALRWLGLLCYNFTLYLGNLVWPVHLSPYRTIPHDLSPGNPAILASMFVTLAVGVLWLSSRRWSRSFFVCFPGFIILLSPALGGVHFAATCVSDRFLYLPVIMLLIPLAVFLSRDSHQSSAASVMPLLPHVRHRTRRPPTAVAGWFLTLILLSLGWMAWRQQPVWANSRNLWFHVQASTPDFHLANFYVGDYLLQDQKPIEALKLLRNAVHDVPNNASYLLSLAKACIRTDRVVEGRAYAEQALRLGLGDRQGYGYVVLAESYAATGDTNAAREHLDRANALNWRNALTIVDVGQAALKIARDCPAAVEFHRRAVSQAADDYVVHYALAESLRECGRIDEALAEYEVTIALAAKQGIELTQVSRAMETLRRTREHPAGSAAQQP